MAVVIDGKAVALKVRKEVAAEVKSISERIGKIPGLAVVLVGDDPASKVYVRKKQEACQEVGIDSVKIELPASTTQEQLVEEVKALNNDKKIHGILVQLPLPKQVDEQKIIEAINPAKDVDGFHPLNIGRLFCGDALLAPATPLGVMKLLEESGVQLEGKHVVVVGRSNIVGKPVALMVLKKNATVTICHSKTKNLFDATKQADVLIVAVGRPKLITAQGVKQGAVVIDVGTNRVDGKLVGDVDFDNVKDKASLITPVPGGVGPMTIAMLLSNTLKAFKQIEGI